MKNLRYGITALVCLSIISVLFISSCKNKKPVPIDNNSVSSLPSGTGRRPLDNILELPDANELAANVNGVDIKEREINEIITPDLKEIASDPRYENVSAKEIEEYKKQKREEILQQLIIERLLEEKVKDVNIVVTTQEADEELKKELASKSLTMEVFNEILTENSMSYSDALEQIQKELVNQKFIDSKIADQTSVTEEDAKKFYDDNPKAFETPEQIRASHILVRVEPNAPDDEDQKAKEKIDNLLEQIKEGADFAELAKSTGGFPSAPRGGDLGYFRKGDMAEPFNKTAFALEPNQVSDVVKTEYGYHIIKVTDHKNADVLPFEKVKESVIEYLTNKKKEEAIQKYIKTLIDEAKIEFPKGKELKTALFAK